MRTQNTTTGAGNTTAAHNEDRLVRLPWGFVQDYEDRMEPEQRCEAIKWNSKSVWFSLDDPNLDDLLDNADYYADIDTCPDDGAQRVHAAAKRLLKAYHDQVVEGDEEEAE